MPVRNGTRVFTMMMALGIVAWAVRDGRSTGADPIKYPALIVAMLSIIAFQVLGIEWD